DLHEQRGFRVHHQFQAEEESREVQRQTLYFGKRFCYSSGRLRSGRRQKAGRTQPQTDIGIEIRTESRQRDTYLQEEKICRRLLSSICVRGRRCLFLCAPSAEVY